ncbi:hypothetical protein MHH52_02265 [Paenibacillus sp. FSL K6-0276]|uniref:hypothetical protein n=1 Tax=Paenibacillus sp. FSL K6-0276 TaxID=2921450 RepID=UPI0030EB8A2B
MNPTYPYYGERTGCKESPITFPTQQQNRKAGLESLMNPRRSVFMSTVKTWVQADTQHTSRGMYTYEQDTRL